MDRSKLLISKMKSLVKARSLKNNCQEKSTQITEKNWKEQNVIQPTKEKDTSIEGVDDQKNNFKFPNPLLSYEIDFIFTHYPFPNNTQNLLFSRELGINAVSQYTPSVFNKVLERNTVRSMIETRGQTLENTGREIIIPYTYELPLIRNSVNTTSEEEGDEIENSFPPFDYNMRQQSKNSNEWMRIKVMTPTKIQMGVVDSYFWSSCKNTHQNYPTEDYLEQFYELSRCNNLELSVVASRRTRGKIIKAEVLEYPSKIPLSPNKYFVTLNDGNQLLAMDITNENQFTTTNAIQLQRRIHHPRVGRYKDFEILKEDDQKKILVFGSDFSQNLQVIVIFNYPPDWEAVSVIHLNNELEFEFRMHRGNCFIINEEYDMIVASWNNVFGNAIPIPKSPRSQESKLKITHEYRIDEFPKSNIDYKNLIDQKIVILDIQPPMICNNTHDGIQFFNVYETTYKHDISSSVKIVEQPVYRLWAMIGVLGDLDTKAIGFGDGSAKVLVTNYKIGQHVVIDFANDNIDNTRKANKGNLSWPFNKSLYDPSTNWIESLSKFCPLAIDYCKSLDLTAVVFGNRHLFMVKLYEQNSYKLVKALSAVQLCTPRSITITHLKKVSLVLRPHFILVKFNFRANSQLTDHVKQVYVCRHMSEQFNH